MCDIDLQQKNQRKKYDLAIVFYPYEDESWIGRDVSPAMGMGTPLGMFADYNALPTDAARQAYTGTGTISALDQAFLNVRQTKIGHMIPRWTIVRIVSDVQSQNKKAWYDELTRTNDPDRPNQASLTFNPEQAFTWEAHTDEWKTVSVQPISWLLCDGDEGKKPQTFAGGDNRNPNWGANTRFYGGTGAAEDVFEFDLSGEGGTDSGTADDPYSPWPEIPQVPLAWLFCPGNRIGEVYICGRQMKDRLHPLGVEWSSRRHFDARRQLIERERRCSTPSNPLLLTPPSDTGPPHYSDPKEYREWAVNFLRPQNLCSDINNKCLSGLTQHCVPDSYYPERSCSDCANAWNVNSCRSDEVAKYCGSPTGFCITQSQIENQSKDCFGHLTEKTCTNAQENCQWCDDTEQCIDANSECLAEDCTGTARAPLMYDCLQNTHCTWDDSQDLDHPICVNTHNQCVNLHTQTECNQLAPRGGGSGMQHYFSDGCKWCPGTGCIADDTPCLSPTRLPHFKNMTCSQAVAASTFDRQDGEKERCTPPTDPITGLPRVVDVTDPEYFECIACALSQTGVGGNPDVQSVCGSNDDPDWDENLVQGRKGSAAMENIRAWCRGRCSLNKVTGRQECQ